MMLMLIMLAYAQVPVDGNDLQHECLGLSFSTSV